jgi:hypothetical protein
MQEEYTNEVTLEARLQEVARRYVRQSQATGSQQQQQPHAQQQEGSRAATNDSGQGVGAAPSAGPGSNAGAALGPPAGPTGGGFVPTPSGFAIKSEGAGAVLNGGAMGGGVNGMGMGDMGSDGMGMGNGAQAAPNHWGSNNISGATVMGNGAPVMRGPGSESYGSSAYANVSGTLMHAGDDACMLSTDRSLCIRALTPRVLLSYFCAAGRQPGRHGR